MERPMFSKLDLVEMREGYIHYFQSHSYPQMIRDYRIKRFDEYLAENRFEDIYHELRIMGVRFKEDEE